MSPPTSRRPACSPTSARTEQGTKGWGSNTPESMCDGMRGGLLMLEGKARSCQLLMHVSTAVLSALSCSVLSHRDQEFVGFLEPHCPHQWPSVFVDQTLP